MKIPLKFIFLFLILLSTDFTVFSSSQDLQSIGTASFYHAKFEGRKTASGEVFQNSLYTAAHKTLPFGTLLKVTNLKNGKEVTVKVNDRLPKGSSRIIDLTKAAARDLDFLNAGLTKVKIEIITLSEPLMEEL
jgi:rare lipoprotein A